MAQHNTSAFMLNVYDPRFPLNMTTTRAPQLDGSTSLITLNFDGLIYDSLEQSTHVKPNQVFPERLTGDSSNSHQIFIHESMIGSAFFAINEGLFPIRINNTNVTD